ncbi:MAG TPA: DUF3576 domain-containing protein [Alphaproteobacteria bacterium]|nr:DUF3576 domain-containing protein [Alphaproteobacteria bacterium]
MIDNRASSLARLVVRLLAAATLIVMAACSNENTQYTYPEKTGKGGGASTYSPTGQKNDSVFGADGLNLFGSSKKSEDAGGGGIGVNSYLWRASLDSIAFMPLASADPFGGVIITDWYTPPETPNERFKLNIYILGRQLRADGVKAAVFRQRRDDTGSWIDAAVETKTAIDLENVILTRARQLRIDNERPQ